MADSLVVSDASQALVLADAARGAAERSLVLYDDSDNKRKAKSVGGVPKKGKRFGLPEDKPFRPLPYVELPVGLSEVEVDQFLREQRLEDLNRKLQLQQLEDVEPDIRPPSPPPLYDRQGNRLNTREVRIRKAMLAEFNRLIRYMLKNLENYVPPEGWKPQRLVKKIIIPYEKYPTASFMGVIIGARGVNHKRLQEASGCRIFIRGKDIGDKWQTDEELHMPQHVHIEGDTEEQIETATNLIMPLLNPESPEFEYARTHGMQQVAVVNGFTLKKSEHRCGVCGALGHLGFDCPESEAYSYKMANVKCDICGDRGHVASDCKQAAEQHKKENVDWKEEAEKKRELDAEYERMMSELGLSTGKKKPPAPPAPPGTAPETPLPEAAPETPAPEAAPETPAPVASPGCPQAVDPQV
ncbi:bbp-1 [Symbiodinium sp. KB8]|nr:bbp-1 [Symbiodinium sp. KB8]